MTSPNVFFVGAGGVGKTMLAVAVSDATGLPFVQGKTRIIAEKFGGYAKIESDLDVRDAFQREVFRLTASQVLDQAELGTGFVTDRTFDNIAYASEFGRVARDLARQPLCRVLLRLMRQPQAVVVFIRPCASIVAQARYEGKRSPIYMEERTIERLDAVLQVLLAVFDVSHHVITAESMSVRLTQVLGWIEEVKVPPHYRAEQQR